MEHIAIDIGGRESQICVRAPDGAILAECRLATADLPRYLASRPPARVIVETCAESGWVAAAGQAAGHDVRVVPAGLVRMLGVGARRTKSDQRDARALSAASCRVELPSVHLASPTARARKTLCSTRDALVGARTQTINTVRGWLRQQGMRPRSGEAESFPKRVRTLCPTALPPPIARQLETIEYLTAQIAAANRELADLVRADRVCQRLCSVPGVGPITATRFTATLDTPDRFPAAHTVGAYLGLVPGEHSSGDRHTHLGITKAGAPAMRTTLVQAAWALRRARPSDPMVQWARRIERRRGRKVATVALARKLSGVLYALWRDGTGYDPARATRQ